MIGTVFANFLSFGVLDKVVKRNFLTAGGVPLHIIVLFYVRLCERYPFTQILKKVYERKHATATTPVKWPKWKMTRPLMLGPGQVLLTRV